MFGKCILVQIPSEPHFCGRQLKAKLICCVTDIATSSILKAWCFSHPFSLDKTYKKFTWQTMFSTLIQISHIRY